jgi:UDP-N-acetylglucosamine 2-epimerase
MNVFCIDSGSGTTSEGSAILGGPAVTLRRLIERPEAPDICAIALTGLDQDVLIDRIRIAIAEREMFSGIEREVLADYLVRNTAERALRLITSTAKFTNRCCNKQEFSRYDWI